MSAIPAPYKRGWLRKKGNLVSGYRRKLCVVDNGFLRCFDTEDSDQTSEIDLKNYHIETNATNAKRIRLILDTAYDNPTQPTGLQQLTTVKRYMTHVAFYHFEAETEIDAIGWVQSLVEARQCRLTSLGILMADQVRAQTLIDDNIDLSTVRTPVETLVSRVQNSQTTDDAQVTIAEMAVVERALAPQIEAARAKTEEILSEPCSGRKDDDTTIRHVLKSICNGMGKEMVLFDSSETPDLPNSLMNLSVAFGEESQQLDIRLENFDDLDLSFEEEKTVSVASLNAGGHQDVVRKLREKLAVVHGVPAEAIEIQEFYEGSKGVKYTVKDLKQDAIAKLQNLEPKLRTQFSSFLEAKVHPLFYRAHFDISMFHHAHNKDFENESSTYNVGPPGQEKPYKQPNGWYRFALKVLGVYDTDDWIHPFGNSRMWYKAYHGTNTAQPCHFDDASKLLNDAKQNAIANIYKNGFHVSGSDGLKNSGAVYGKGVYCATDPDSAYVATTRIDTVHGPKSFKFLIMCAVNPADSFFSERKVINGGKWWVVRKKENIRMYGLLVKEM